MTAGKSEVIVVGCGIGGMAAAVAALERGGQTRYTEAYLRMKSEDEVTDDFESHLAENASGYLDPSLVHLTSEPRENWPGLVKALSLNDAEWIAAFAAAATP